MPKVPLTLAAFFTPQARSRGERYFNEGRVRLRNTSPTYLEATVRGSRPYTVTVAVQDDRIATSCTCPYANDFDTGCKHVWATILAAADEGTALEQRPSLLHGHPAATRDDNPNRHIPRRLERDHDRHRAHHDRDHDRDRTPRWRRELDRIRAERAAARPFGELKPTGSPPASWPADRRVAYILDTVGPRDGARLGDGVVIELATQKRVGHSGWGPPRKFTYTHAEWLTVPDDDDREIDLRGARQRAEGRRRGGRRHTAALDRRSHGPT